MTATKQSAGILLYRIRSGVPQLLLAHPGGPFWTKKDVGSWTIPKGEVNDGEIPLHAAIREFKEETGFLLSGNFIPLKPLKQRSGKLIWAWLLEGDLDVTRLTSSTFELEWPLRSGKIKSFPEIDKASWFDLKEAQNKINSGQLGFIHEFLSFCPGLIFGSEFDQRI